MTAQRAILVTCNSCGFEQPITERETVVAPTIHGARLYLSMQGWSRRGYGDVCNKHDCQESTS